MGEIRSALDIALEKTAHIEGDSKTAESRELKNIGKRAAGAFLEKHDEALLAASLDGKSPDKANLVRQGAVSIFLASLKLPVTEEDLTKTDTAGAGLNILLATSGMDQLFAQVHQILTQYLAEKDQLRHALEQQYLPRLRQKQAEIERRYGQTIPLELHQDPEYSAAWSKNNRALVQKYETVIEEVRSRVRESAGIEE